MMLGNAEKSNIIIIYMLLVYSYPQLIIKLLIIKHKQFLNYHFHEYFSGPEIHAHLTFKHLKKKYLNWHLNNI